MQTSAPGKLILCGEHAVVYGYPALAIPLSAIRATVSITPAAPGSGLTVAAPELGLEWRLHAAEPLAHLAARTLDYLALAEPDTLLLIHSAIPIASGMGSGAAVGAALVRALATIAGSSLDAGVVSELVYASERSFHGTPSGIDNTVVAWEQPIRFQRHEPPPHRIEPIRVGRPWHFVIGDTGVAATTRVIVEQLRGRYTAEPTVYGALFERIGVLVDQIQAAITHTDGSALGWLLSHNHELLQAAHVSSPKLDRFVAAAQAAGAWGAKLSGAGGGGVMLAVVDPQLASSVETALYAAGARRVWHTVLEETYA